MIEKAGRYRIIEEVGRGSMGVVYRGFDPTISRSVAIKTILLDTGNPELLMRFQREAQAAGVLSHSNIVTIYDAGEDQGFFYIAMEYVQGETLQARIARGAVPFEEALKIIEQVGAALDHAHARKVIHRDVKPANVMLSPDGVAKVMDFGVAKLANLNVTTPGQILGTPSYIPPEMVKGLATDGRSDIFSLGIVLYEMLSGSKPFAGPDLTAVMYKIVHEPPDATPQFKAQLQPALEQVLDKVLAKDPEKRYQTCALLAADLKKSQSLKIKPNLKPAAAPVTKSSTGTVILDSKELQPQRPKPRPRPPAPAPAQPEPRVLWSVRPGFILAVALLVAVVGGATFWALNRFFATAVQVEKTTPVQPQQKAARPKKDAGSAVVRAAPVAPDPAKFDTTEFFVGSNVEGAHIFVDGVSQPEWVTPRTLAITPGPHRIEVRKPGYKSQSQFLLFNINNGPQRKNFILEPVEPRDEPAVPGPTAPPSPPSPEPPEQEK